MSKIPSLKPKEVIGRLNELGFEFHKQKGSHRIYVKGERHVIVPYHNKDLKKGTLMNIVKGAGVPAEEFFGRK